MYTAISQCNYEITKELRDLLRLQAKSVVNQRIQI